MQFFVDVAKIVANQWQTLLIGVRNTLFLALVGTLLGLLIGLLIGILRTTPLSAHTFPRVLHKIANVLCTAYIEVFRGTPMMVQAMVIYWGCAFATGGITPPLIPAGIAIVSINTGAYMAEIVRGGIISIEKGQFEGASAIGMTHMQTMLYIVLPQVIRNILPSVSNEFIINIKDTSVLNVIGMAELYFYAAVIQRETLLTFETYCVVCVLYFILTFSISRLLRFLEKKLDGKATYTICGSQSDPDAEIKIRQDRQI